MADKDVKIKVTLEGREAELGLRDLTKAMKSTDDGAKASRLSFTELNQSIELANKAVSLVRGAYASLSETIAHGQDVFEASNAFKDLQEKAGQTAEQGIGRLREAVQGMVSDFELMKQANLASTFGTTQEQFVELAASADKLGGSVGKSLPEALEILNRAFGSGRERALQQLGINIKLTESEEEFRNSLDDTGQLLFTREKIMEAVRAKTAQLSDADKTAGDALEQFQATLENVIDRTSQNITQNEDLRDTIDEITNSLNGVNGQKLIDLLNDIIELAAKGASALVHLRENVNFVFSPTAQVGETVFGSLKQELDSLQNNNQVSEFVAKTKAELQKVEEQLYQIEEQGGIAQAFGVDTPETIALEGKIKGLNDALSAASEKQKQLSEAQVTGTRTTTEAAEAVRKGNENLEKYRKKNEEAAQKVHDLTNEFSKLTAEIENKGIAQALDKGIEKLSDVDFAELKTKLLDNATDAFKLSLEKYKDLHVDTDALIAKNRENLEKELDEKRLAATIELQKKADEEQKKAYDESITFWRSTFENAITGVSFSLEDALKQVAVGFAAQAAQELLGNFGGIFGSLKSPQDFGGAIFSGIFGGGAGGGIGSILSGGASLASAGSLLGSSSSYGAGLSAGLQGGFAPGALGTAAANAQTAQSAYSGLNIGATLAGKGSLGLAVPIGLGAIGAYFLADKLGAIEGNFGGTTNAETQARRDFRTSLQSTGLGQNLEFQGVKGITSLFSSDYSLGQKNQFTGDAVGLANPLAQVLAGGDDKLASDIAGIFADATDEADSFNEVLVNTLSLMDKMGTNAQEQKDQLTALFLDGKVSLDEFTTGIASLNVLAQDNLVGKGSVAEAMKIVAENIETGPGQALKGFELALKEAAELGITSMSGLGAYLSDRLGPQGVAVFDRLQAAGITSFEDIQNASADQVALIFNELTGIQGLLTDVFSTTANQAANTFASAAQKIGGAAKQLREDISNINKELKDTKEKADALEKSKQGRDPNPPLGEGA